jgi:hypothetical protein
MFISKAISIAKQFALSLFLFTAATSVTAQGNLENPQRVGTATQAA